MDQMIKDEAPEHHGRMKIKKQQKPKQETHPNALSTVERISAGPRRSWRRRGYAGQSKGLEAGQLGAMETLGDVDHGDMLCRDWEGEMTPAQARRSRTVTTEKIEERRKSDWRALQT